MLLIPQENLTEGQKAAWDAAIAAASSLEPETGDGTGWMFHGTDHLSSTYILHDGFRDRLNTAEAPERTWAYFGSIAAAVHFAEERMDADSPPALLAVKTADLIAAGISIDPNYADDETVLPPDWESHVRDGGTVRVRGGAKFPSLRRFSISEVPLHPDAFERRQDRISSPMRFYGRCMPHPDEAPHLVDIEEARPDAHTGPGR